MIVNAETTTSGITTVAFIGLIKITKAISPILILHRWRANRSSFKHNKKIGNIQLQQVDCFNYLKQTGSYDGIGQ